MHRAPPNELMTSHYVFPSNHVAATVIVYGFLAFLLARRVGMLEGVLVAAASTIVVIVVALAGVYFGRYWVSDAIGGAALAYVWVAIVALTAMWRHPQAPPPTRVHARRWCWWSCCVSVGAQLGVNPPAPPPGSMQRVAARAGHAIGVDAARCGSACRVIARIWAATARSRSRCSGCRTSIRSADNCAPRGGSREPTCPRIACFRSPRPMSRRCRCRSCRSSTTACLRRWSSCVPATRATNATCCASGRAATRWRTAPPPTPLWVGALAHERLSRPSWPLNILRVDQEADVVRRARENSAGLGAAIVATVDCHGVPVSLLASPVE